MVLAGRNISRVFYAVTALVVFAGDQVTKHIIESSIPERGTVTVIPGFFNLANVKNVGAAFGLFADSPAAWKTGPVPQAPAGAAPAGAAPAGATLGLASVAGTAALPAFAGTTPLPANSPGLEVAAIVGLP